MAIYHLSVKCMSRKKGQSAVAAAAYRSGEKLYDKRYGLEHDYTFKRGVYHTEIILPPNAPDRFRNREILWNEVERAEKRSDARVAREIDVALPNELNLKEHKELLREYVRSNFVKEGMCADISIHRPKSDNPHAHILLTTRPIEGDGFSKRKKREWDKRANVRLWRERWEIEQNRDLERKGLEIRISHKSYIEQGIDYEPTKHLGRVITGLERRGIKTDRGNENRAIKKRNREREEERNRQRSGDRSR